MSFAAKKLVEDMNSPAIVVLTTVANAEEGETLARKIVEAKLAACVQILPAMKSVYFWENKIQVDAENLLLIKTITERYDELERFIQANHSYDTPEIVALAAENISGDYLEWLRDYLR